MIKSLMVSALLLAACGGTDGNSSSSSCSLVGTWGTSSNATPAFVFAQGGTFAGNITANNTLSGTWSLDGNTGTFVNTAKGANSDPTFDACLGVTGKYNLTFASGCGSFTWAAVSDTCAGRLQLQSATFTKR